MSEIEGDVVTTLIKDYEKLVAKLAHEEDAHDETKEKLMSVSKGWAKEEARWNETAAELRRSLAASEAREKKLRAISGEMEAEKDGPYPQWEYNTLEEWDRRAERIV